VVLLTGCQFNSGLELQIKKSNMRTVTDIEQLHQLKANGAIFIFFGGESCAVCKSLRPKIESVILHRLPKMRSVYIDCELSPDICAQHSVFTLPAVKAYIEGMLVAEDSRSLSVELLVQKIERSYTIWSEL
jgi:thioredoxin-like negative regulator of GroEL